MLPLGMSEEPPKHFNFAHDVVERWARERPEGLALWCVHESDSTEQKFTFKQIAQDLRRAASFFISSAFAGVIASLSSYRAFHNGGSRCSA